MNPGGATALFDRIIMVDWSAASKPKRGTDSIWIATAGESGCALENPATRRAAEEQLLGLLVDEACTTLLGVDFSLGYPAGTAAALGLGGPPWRAMWELLEREVDDDRHNHNNRFEVAALLNRRLANGIANGGGPFWGCPAQRPLEGLTATKPASGRLPEWRTVEAAMRAGGWRPFSSWQLLGAGCVGSQSLVGIPVLERLRRRAPGRVQVWPFTTGLTVPAVEPGSVVVAEIWPSLETIAEPVAGRVRDAAQVETLASRFRRLDRDGALAALFTPAVDPAKAGQVCAEEGWVLGAGADDRRSAVAGARG